MPHGSYDQRRLRRLTRSLALLAACPLFPAFPILPLAQQDPPATSAAQALRDRLRSGPGPVRIIVFGDSLAAGWGPKDPTTEAYAAVFGQALRARYPECRIEVIWAGGPGDPSDVGLIRLHDEVLRRKPDVVVVQFGGNDERLRRSARDLEEDLVEIVRRVNEALPEALCLIATPPMNDREPGTPYVRAAVLAAQAAGVPVADFDGALRAGDRDFRGPFCWGAHPGAYPHLLMGRELLRAWDVLVGAPGPLTVRINGYSVMLRAGEPPEFRIQARNASETELAVDLEYGPALLAGREQLTVPPQGALGLDRQVALPALDPGRRTRTYRVSALGRSIEQEASDLDLKWLSIAPVVVPDVAEDERDPAGLTWHAFGADSIVKGASLWGGDDDLGARFAVISRETDLTFLVEVSDNDLSGPRRGEHMTDGDSVELCLDLRPPADQGKPVYSPDVVLLVVKPGMTAREEAIWAPLDELSPRLTGVTAESTLTPRGYAVRLSLPREALRRGEEEALTGLGFDVHVNDADFGLGRERQMVWAGAADNFLDPSALAALAEPGSGPWQYRATLR
jgi:lysophospholipase L1-like esterase